MIELNEIKRTDPRLLADMAIHYSQPGGFVGRNICYAVESDGIYYGGIVGGSATRFLPGRDQFFQDNGINPSLNEIVNNIFYHVEKKDGAYPCRNFVPKVLALFREKIAERWVDKYGDPVLLFESLVELPRTGDCYHRDGWEETGLTKGYTCKRIAGKGTDSWTGKRVWNTTDLRPKRVFLRLPTSFRLTSRKQDFTSVELQSEACL
jgi:hypothetical protein